ncbi:hypothetical protein LOTGIDRAFT_165776 [Lottia gigantea]|uniref:F5/8 type C domain-containing protein n=1 Tax=Lottia gigantea TaxID=225164 RepID=V3ZBG1_LOTGI|nr:hypothetical protein LOTGIDRAFT_165776 [Lottia gigantea]ESO88333.1 hypothetical protein LOTGIDRAFT_165776 [Lottia gigantea]
MDTIIIQWLLLVQIYAAGDTTSNELYTLYHSNKLISGYYRKFITLRPICGAWCQLFPQCSAFAYHNLQKECFLYEGNLNDCDYLIENTMETFIPFTEEDKNNVALFKPTTMSSELSRSTGSCRAVDDKYTTFVSSQQAPMSWWCVDLIHIYNLKYVTLYNKNKAGYVRDQIKGFTLKLNLRGKCDAEGFSNADFCFQDTSFISQYIYNITQCISSTVFKARYIFINNGAASDFLHFKELEVSAM